MHHFVISLIIVNKTSPSNQEKFTHMLNKNNMFVILRGERKDERLKMKIKDQRD